MNSNFVTSLLCGLFSLGVILFSPIVAKADTGDVWDLASGSGCGPDVLGPTAAVDVDDDGVEETLVVVYVVTGRAVIHLRRDGFFPYAAHYSLQLQPQTCSTDGHARVNIRFVNMLHPNFDPADDTTWVDKTLPALRIDVSGAGTTVGPPPVLNVFAYRDPNQTPAQRIDPIYGTETGSGTKVFSDPGGIREITIRTSHIDTLSEELILMATEPNTLQGTDVTADLNNGSVTFSQVTIPGNTFIQETDTGDPLPTDMAVCAPWPAPPYFTLETNADAGSANVCVNYPDSCNESDLRLLSYRPPIGNPTPSWQDVTGPVNTATNTICSEFYMGRSDPFVVAQPIADNDGDGFTNVTDCDDNDNTVYPGAPELCIDLKDNDCDGSADCIDGDCVLDPACIVCTDYDGDGYAAEGGACGPIDCNDDDQTMYPGAVEICDTKDNDCDFYTLDGEAELWIGTVCDGADSDFCIEGEYLCSFGVQTCSDFSSDDVEICDGADNDCDDLIDEGVANTYYRDFDGDGFGEILNSIQSCLFNPPAGYVTDRTDCNDNDSGIHPNATEVCDNVDNNCDGNRDEGFDRDNDLVSDCFDNCPDVYNREQDDSDGDGLGDACTDTDNDGWYDPVDNCPRVKNEDQADDNGNGIGNACEYDLSIDRVEFIQVVQDADNSVPLVYGKNTWIRVYLGVGTAQAALGAVVGTLRFVYPDGSPMLVYINGVAQFGFPGVPSSNSILAMPSSHFPDVESHQADFGSTLNFFIPKNWLWGGGSPNIEINVTDLSSRRDVNPYNNYFGPAPLSFRSPPELKIKFVPVYPCRTGFVSGGACPPPSRRDFRKAARWMENLYPIVKVSKKYGGNYFLTWDPTWIGPAGVKANGGLLLAGLSILNFFDGHFDGTKYYGMVCKELDPQFLTPRTEPRVNGMGNLEAAWGVRRDHDRTWKSLGGQLMAHEIGHTIIGNDGAFPSQPEAWAAHVKDDCRAGPPYMSYPRTYPYRGMLEPDTYGFDGSLVYSPKSTWDFMTYSPCQDTRTGADGTCSITTTKACSNDSFCNSGRCAEVGSCSTDSTRSCVVDSDCPNDVCVGVTMLLKACDSDRQCSEGERCVGFCSATLTTPCRNDSSCPKGESCLEPEFCHRGQWISATNYKRIFTKLSGESALRSIQAMAALDGPTQEYLVTSGVISIDDEVLARRSHRLELPVGTDDETGAGPYSLELQNQDGSLLYVRYFSLTGQADPLTGIGVFAEAVPYDPNTTSILLMHGDLVLETIPVSSNNPEVIVTFPNGGEALSGEVTVSWTATDADQDTLTYDVVYSSDNGATWSAWAVGLEETSYVWNTDQASGTSQGLIRVYATDGVNTGYDDSDAPLTVARKPPDIMILAPEDHSSFFFGEMIILEGGGYDLEDGELGDPAFSWDSDVDGALGVGSTLSFDDLSPGEHTITFWGEDSDGNVGTEAIVILISEVQDSDGDRVGDDADNCPAIYNRDQADVDDDGLGDICDDNPYGGFTIQDLNGIPGIQCPGANCVDGEYTTEDWTDVIRVALAGMHHDDADNIGMQDCNSDVRWSILETRPDLFGTCTNASCEDVDHAWRLPDDDPGMDTFLQLLGLPGIDDAPFCNGDELEDNDPIRRACADGEDVCQPSGTLGFVLPIVPGPGSTEPCSLGVFRWKILPFTRFECPQGINPLFGLCLQPQDAEGNFGCLNPAFNKSFGTPGGVDGRVHNLWPLNADGTAPIVDGKEMVAAFDRIHTANTIADGANVCLEPTASDRIACLTEASPCTMAAECSGGQ